MRDYAKVSPKFWTGETGRSIRSLGADAQVVALYLLTSPNSNWIGLYYLPLPTLCHETGMGQKSAMKCLYELERVGFSRYDHENEVVWVPNTARFQIGDRLKGGDKRIPAIKKDLQQYEKSPFAREFYDKYHDDFSLPEMDLPEAPSKPLRSPFEAPSKPVTEAVTVTGTGKREGDTPPRPRPSRTVPDSYVISEKLLAWAKAERPDIDITTEIAKFRDWEFKDPRRDWDRAFRTWIRRADGGLFRGQRPTPPPDLRVGEPDQPPSPMTEWKLALIEIECEEDPARKAELLADYKRKFENESEVA